MTIIEFIFWLFAGIVFYSYAGYGIVLYTILKIKRSFIKSRSFNKNNYTPTISFIVPCYNEASILSDKVKNTLSLDYPAEKLQIIFITDGSTDGSEKVMAIYDNVLVLHRPERRGKSAAENRSVSHATGEIIVFSDANTYLQPHTLKKLARHYVNPMVGAVSGEKRIQQELTENAAGSGEGIYWKYESMLKRWDSELLTVVGAAGELFSFRKHLFESLEEDTILDDFILSLRITQKGYRVIYEPEATAFETSSSNTHEELKRKIRICAGGWQAMSRMSGLLNFFKHPVLTFQYISHRVLRWTLAPLGIFLMLPANIALAFHTNLYSWLLVLHLTFYIAAIAGWIFENRSIRIKALFVPYYFLMMNYAVIAGFIRFINGKQSSAWERSERKIQINSQTA